MTRTNAQTHDIIRGALDRSPLFSGDIEGRGPRYCPSIEDKVHRFGDRDGHQVFLEPEGLGDPLVYPNGVSTSLPADVQLSMMRSMAGLERVEIVQAGYAVEYDHIDPRALTDTLEVDGITGLFCAGQINGTTGYEEASAQGLVAGLNAAARAIGVAEVRFDRASSYIGVMVDDLVLQGITEPYRMLTARAEYRLRLRADNAATRLTPDAIAAGCVGQARRDGFQLHRQNRESLTEWLCQTSLRDLNGGSGERTPLFEQIRISGWGRDALLAAAPRVGEWSCAIVDEVIEDARYAPYVARQEAEIRAMHANDRVRLFADFDYAAIPGLSNEMVERLDASRPDTLGAASRIRGITPAALAAILVHARRAAA